MKKLIVLLLACLLLAGCGGYGRDLPLEETVWIDLVKEPPVLTVMCADAAADAHIGTYSWGYDTGSGTWSNVCADSSHPLESKEWLEAVEVDEETLTLSFEVEPESFTIRCWEDSQWENLDAEETAVKTSGNEITLQPGGYIYEVVAQFESEHYNGTVYYSFYVVYDRENG